MFWYGVTVQGARAPVSKLPFLTIGVGTEQIEGFVTVTVVATVVETVVGDGAAVRMQEHALLSLDAGNEVVAGRSRFALPAVTVALQDC